MGLEMWLWAAVIPVILDNTDPGAEVHLIQPDPFPYCNTGKGTKALALAQKHCEWALQSKRAAYPPQPHRQEVPGSLLQPSGHGTAFICSIRLPYPYKGYPQENSPVGTIPVLHWLLNKVQRLSGRAFVSHGHKQKREFLQGPLRSSAQKQVLFKLPL